MLSTRVVTSVAQLMPRVGVLEDKSSSSRIIEDNFEFLGLGVGLESRVFGLGLVTQVLGKTRRHTLHQSLHVLLCCVLCAVETGDKRLVGHTF